MEARGERLPGHADRGEYRQAAGIAAQDDLIYRNRQKSARVKFAL
jgi:hypothetical protein